MVQSRRGHISSRKKEKKISMYIFGLTGNRKILDIHDLFGTELAMIFSFHVGLPDSVRQRIQLFSISVCSTFCCHCIARFIILIFVRN
jgi:hypothetical protein